MGSRLTGLLLTLALALFSTGAATAADDTEAPKLVSLQFSPSIKTSTGPAEVKINFTATDDASGVTYFEMAFVDPSGTFRQSASAKLAPALSAAGTVRSVFPRFSTSGTWTLAHVFLSDSAGNTLSLDTEGLNGRGFPTRLEVLSAMDSVGPKLTALDFAPTTIDTSAGPADLKLNYSVTDDVAGVSYFELSFVSPSGAARRGGTVRFETVRAASDSMTISFPRLSEAGQWTLSNLFLADGAGNTLILDAEGLTGLGFRTTLQVVSAQDTVSPRLTSLNFTPEVIDTGNGPATVIVECTATDNFSGVKSIEVVFLSPLGTTRRSGFGMFSPSAEVRGSVGVSFPRSSEPGQWVLSGVLLTDAAGNTLALDAEGIPAVVQRTALLVNSTVDEIPPALASLGFEEDAIDTSRGPVAVKVQFKAVDDLSGVKSIEIAFVSVSGNSRQSASATFQPAAEVTDAVTITFPRSSEAGGWIIGSAMVTDHAGNTLVRDADTLPFRKILQVR